MTSAPRIEGEAATVPTVDVATLLATPEATIVDLRSPAEFAEDHVPGAVSVPLFDDLQRAVVGWLYRRASPERAYREGLGLVRAKIEGLVAEVAAAAGRAVSAARLGEHFESLSRGGIEAMDERLRARPAGVPPPHPIVLCCWRGGLRSRSVVALLRALGFDDALALEGGTKAYRRHVRATLEEWEAPPAFVLRGLTGVGKTLVLRELERLRPGWTIDLEAAAGHRSSLLGAVGLEPATQKTFESRLAARLRAGFPGGCVVFEGESRKVGDAVVPHAVWAALQGGTNVELVAPPERRVDVLVADYLARPSDRGALRERLAAVEERTRPRQALVELFDAGEDRRVAELLLDGYYDPLYRHSERGKRYATTIDATDPRAAAEEVAAWIGAR